MREGKRPMLHDGAAERAAGPGGKVKRAVHLNSNHPMPLDRAQQPIGGTGTAASPRRRRRASASAAIAAAATITATSTAATTAVSGDRVAATGRRAAFAPCAWTAARGWRLTDPTLTSAGRWATGQPTGLTSGSRPSGLTGGGKVRRRRRRRREEQVQRVA